MNVEEYLKTSIVAILGDDKEVIGTGFILSNNTICTCLHVVYDADGAPGQSVLVKFYCDGSIQSSFMDKMAWSPLEKHDVAILRLNQTLPSSARTVSVGIPETSPGHNFFTFGYAKLGSLQGISARGQIIDLVQNKQLVQLDSSQIARGMSGAPVVDLVQNRVVGMVSFGKEEQFIARNAFTTLATSTDIILMVLQQMRDIDINSENNQAEKLGLYLQVGLERIEESFQLMDQPYLNPDECQCVYDNLKMAWDDYLFHFYRILGETNSNYLSQTKATLLASADINYERISGLLPEIKDYKDICLDATTSAQNKRASLFRALGDVRLNMKELLQSFVASRMV